MGDIVIQQMPAFKKIYKKLHKQDKPSVNDAIKAIVANPELGNEKKGDLANVYVYKFKLHKKEMLLAYEWNPRKRILIALGVHENFYHDLKIRR